MSPSLRRPALSFRDGNDMVTVPLSFDISSNSPVFNREMVMRDFGIGVVPRTLVEPELASGALVQLLEGADLVDAFVEIKLAYATARCCPRRSRRSSTTQPPTAAAHADGCRRARARIARPIGTAATPSDPARLLASRRAAP
jgi:DNA-binding transcriptional LysR family regulator